MYSILNLVGALPALPCVLEVESSSADSVAPAAPGICSVAAPCIDGERCSCCADITDGAARWPSVISDASASAMPMPQGKLSQLTCDFWIPEDGRGAWASRLLIVTRQKNLPRDLRQKRTAVHPSLAALLEARALKAALEGRCWHAQLAANACAVATHARRRARRVKCRPS